MALEQHTVSVPTGANPARTDRTLIGSVPNVPNAAGAAGATVSTAVAMSGLPSAYSVQVTPGQEAYAWVTNKTSSGFTVNLAPISSSASIAAGTFDAVVVA